ncbi:MAG: hypothetical protein K2M90_01105 [Treponemataceae bacterium]|nr:hypothetical protein [Treponemataceae bacterium]
MKPAAPLAILACLFAAQAETYRITDVAYDITGKTKEYAIQNAVDIDTTRVFNSADELDVYVQDLQQQFNNQREFESAAVEAIYGDTDAEGTTPVSLRVVTKDSDSFIAVPYPKYNSNDGFDFKLKMKDMNFLGTMSIMNFDVNFAIENDEDDSEKHDYVIGLNFSYDYPFKLGPFKSSWNNNFGINYTFGTTKPEFDVSTRLSFELPFDQFSVCLSLTQSATRDVDYEKYGDELYFTEAAALSLPVTLAKIDGWGKVRWTPSLSHEWNWDQNGINKENDDLSSPLLTVAHSVSTSRVDWIGNFRDGLSVELGQSIGYNFQRKEFVPKVWATFMGYKAFSYVGVTGRLYGFAMHNGDEEIGSLLRGIRDNVKYASDDAKLSAKKAAEVPAAFVANIDVPIHIVTTHWNDWFAALFGEDAGITRALRFMRYLDFELQLSPFIDIALTKNAATGRLFSIQDGYYTGGLEVLVFPANWRSLEIRARVGVAVGRKIIHKIVPKLIDTSWRHGSAYEISVGIGLHY